MWARRVDADATLSTREQTRADELGKRAAIGAEVWDGLRQRRMMGGDGARIGAIVENIIAAIQARVEPSEWRQGGASTAEAIERRTGAPSAVAQVLARLRPAIPEAGRSFRAEHLGTDAVGRGAGWWKTANAVEAAKACNDAMVAGEIGSGELFRALKDIVVTALHGLGPKEAAEAGGRVARLIERRMVVN